MIRHTEKSKQRSGLATLEFVMVFPILILFFVLIYLVFRYYSQNALLTIDARAQSVAQKNVKWNREEKPMPDNSMVISLVNPDKRQFGLIDTSLSKDLSLQAIREGIVVIRSYYSVLGGPWDHKGIEFKLRRPHDPIDQRAFAMAMAPPEALLISLDSINFVNNGGDLKQMIQLAIAGSDFGKMASFVDDPKKFLESYNVDPTKIDEFIRESGDVTRMFNKAVDGINSIKSLLNSQKDLDDDY